MQVFNRRRACRLVSVQHYVVIDFIESAGLGQHAKTISVFYCTADASCGDQAFAAIKLTGLASADFLVCEMVLSAKVPCTNFSVSLNESLQLTEVVMVHKPGVPSCMDFIGFMSNNSLGNG